jgi:multicomponent Na+:H+ antiporter subunit B
MKTKIFTFAALAVIAAGFCWCSGWLPQIGDASSPPNTHVSDYYIEHSEEDTASKNIVSGTLADYRGFDTMFETSVMFVSGLVVTLLLVQEKKGDKKE